MKLPKKHKRTEAKVDSLVLKWFEKNWDNSCAVEVKVIGNDVLDHQDRALKKVAGGSFSYKIPDMGRRNCYDGFVLKNADAFLVTCDKYICQVFNYKNNETFQIKIR
jgi:hypothetical protein